MGQAATLRIKRQPAQLLGELVFEPELPMILIYGPNLPDLSKIFHFADFFYFVARTVPEFTYIWREQ